MAAVSGDFLAPRRDEPPLQQAVPEGCQRGPAACLTLGEFTNTNQPDEPGRLGLPLLDPGRQGRAVFPGDIEELDILESCCIEQRWVAVIRIDMLWPGVERPVPICGAQMIGDRDDEERQSPAIPENPPLGSQHGELVGQSTEHIRARRRIKGAIAQRHGISGGCDHASVDALIFDSSLSGSQAVERYVGEQHATAR